MSRRHQFANREAAELSGESVGFSFGSNWQRFAARVGDAQIAHARASLRESFLDADLAGRLFVDVGCGSGLFSYCAHLEGARVWSIDVDPQSVVTAAGFRERAGNPESWTVEQGSMLDDEFRSRLPWSDRVYSWGVLHHTGAMWRAIEATYEIVAPGGLFCLALYTQPRFSGAYMALKRTYNKLPRAARPLIVGSFAGLRLAKRLVVDRESPVREVRSYTETSRGMSYWHDIADWLGGLPIEFATASEVARHAADHGFEVVNVAEQGRGANNEYLLRRVAS